MELLGRLDFESFKIPEIRPISDFNVVDEFNLEGRYGNITIFSRTQKSNIWLSKSLIEFINGSNTSKLRVRKLIVPSGVQYRLTQVSEDLCGSIYVEHDLSLVKYNIF